MIARFILYSILKNLRFFEPFFILYLLAGSQHGGPGLSYFQMGGLVGYQKLLTGFLEIPSGFATDRWGRRRALALCFMGYSVAFPLYALASGYRGSAQLALLVAGQTAFGIAEAFRTGSHKAIILDWADHTGRSAEATRILGLARFFSKLSAAISALVGGLIVYATASFTPLFWASAVPALGGLALMLSYPSYLEGEMTRDVRAREGGFRQHLRRLIAAPALRFLILQSILLEACLKLAQLYVQPFFKEGFDARDITIIGGVGALAVGAYYFVQDLVGGTAAMLSAPIERRWGNRSLIALYIVAASLCALMAISFQWGLLAVGMAGFVGLAALQNARRPLFVSQLNQVMDKPQRAATLSIESQARTWAVAALAPLTGWVADHGGLGATFAGITGLLALGLVLYAIPGARAKRD